MNTSFEMDFGLFYLLFFERARSAGYKVPTIVREILGDKNIPNTRASSYKTGQEPVANGIVNNLQNCSNSELASRFESILTGKKRADSNPFNEQICNEISEHCEENIMALIKLAKAETLIFRNSQTLSSLEDNSITTFSKIAYLFIESLPMSTDTFQKRSSEYYDSILELISGGCLPSKPSNLPVCYYNSYNVYYFSAHYENEVHCGMLRVYKDDNGQPVARYIYGLTSTEKLKNSLLLQAINAPTNVQAKELFDEYLKTVKYGYDKRVYLMNGLVDSTDYEYYLRIDFTGVGSRSNDALTLYLNLSRVSKISRIGYKYNGGLGFVIVAPHKTTPKIRVHRIGVADCKTPVDLENETLKKVLQLNPTNTHRLQVQMDDDREFWNFLLKCEAKIYI